MRNGSSVVSKYLLSLALLTAGHYGFAQDSSVHYFRIFADTHVSVYKPEQSYGYSSKMVVFRNRSHVGFAKFLVPPVAGNVQTAWLELHVQEVQRTGEISLYALTEDLTTQQVTYNTQPAYEADPFATFAVNAGDAGQTISVDITDQVKAWASGENFGMALETFDAKVLFDTQETEQGSPARIKATTTGVPVFTRELTHTVNLGVNGTTDTLFGCPFSAVLLSCGYGMQPRTDSHVVPFNLTQDGQCEIGFVNHGPRPANDLTIRMYARCLLN